MPELRVVEAGICDGWRGFRRSVERVVGFGWARHFRGMVWFLRPLPYFPMCVAEGVAALGVCLCCSPRFVSRPMSYQDWPKLLRCTMISLELCLLYLQEQTFSWPPLTSGFDPMQTLDKSRFLVTHHLDSCL